MKESIGNAFVFGIFITFAFLLMLILTTSINYSRASKIKDRLLSKIQAYAEAKSTTSENGFEKIDFDDDDFVMELNSELASLGYRRNEGGFNQNNCPDRDGAELMNPNSIYKYCVYAYETSRGYY